MSTCYFKHAGSVHKLVSHIPLHLPPEGFHRFIRPLTLCNEKSISARRHRFGYNKIHERYEHHIMPLVIYNLYIVSTEV